MIKALSNQIRIVLKIYSLVLSVGEVISANLNTKHKTGYLEVSYGPYDMGYSWLRNQQMTGPPAEKTLNEIHNV